MPIKVKKELFYAVLGCWGWVFILHHSMYFDIKQIYDN